jgi:hypothetical protein
MRRLAITALAFIGIASAARAEPAECLIEIRSRPLVNGPCDVDFRPDGGFTAEGKSADGASVTLSAFAEGRGRASGLLNIEAGNRHSYDDTGPLDRRGRCWQNAGVKACAWQPGTRPIQR